MAEESSLVRLALFSAETPILVMCVDSIGVILCQWWQVTSILVGRVVEQARVRELVHDVAAGRGRSVLVEGEPGIGKSSLIEAGIEGATELGCRVLRGAADEFSGRFPLRVLLDCFAAGGVGDMTALAGGDWGGVASGSYDPALAAMERLLEAVDKLCTDSPLVLAVDDLQWADEPSLTVWRQLSRSVSQLPLLLLAVSRTAPQRAGLAGLRRVIESEDGVLIQLSPLDQEETVALVGDLAGAPPGPRLARLMVRAGGNPLYIRELVDVLAREGRLKVEPGVAAEVEREEMPVPTSLRAAVADRIESMSAATQQIVRFAALLGPEFSVAELANLSGRPALELADAMMEAYQANVLVDSGERTVFRHPLIRQVLYEAIPAGLRAALHRQAAQALAEAGGSVDRVADQLAASGVMDSWAVGWLVDNGAALVDRASQAVIDLLTQAAGQVPQPDPRREAIEGWMSTVLSRLMRIGELERWARAALASEGISAEHRLEMTTDLAATLRYSDLPEAERVIREALAYDAGGLWGARARAMYAGVLVADRHFGDPYPAIRDAHAAAERTGDRLTLGLTLEIEAVLYGQKNLGKAVSLRQRALAALEGDPQTVSQRMVALSNQIWTLDAMSRMEEGDAAFADMLALARKYPSGRSQVPVNVFAAQRQYHTGHWDDALAAVEAVGELRLEHGFYAVVGLSVGALIAGHRDNRVLGAARLRALDQMPMSELLIRNLAPWMVLSRALAAERDGQPRQALEVLAPMLDTGRDYDIGDRFRWTPELVRIALAADQRDAAEQAARLADEDVRLERLPLRVAAASACRGLLTSDPRPLLEAAELYRGGRRILDRGLALENAAVLLAGRDQIMQARETLAAAMGEYASLAADWDMTRAEARMRPFGIRLGRLGRLGQRGPRGRPSSGWEALTPAELRVASLVADGLSNPAIAAGLFLSRQTVQTHMSHILAKLGAHSRVQVAREADRHRTDQPA
jgi:DNA-binding CsgD family transcriptional regulator